MHLVTRKSLSVTSQRWRSHHSINNRRNPHVTHKLHGCMCYRTGSSYCLWKFYVARTRIFDLFCSCDLDLDPMSFIYELGRITSRCIKGPKMNFIRHGFLKLSYCRQTYRQTNRHTPPKSYTTPPCGCQWHPQPSFLSVIVESAVTKLAIASMKKCHQEG